MNHRGGPLLNRPLVGMVIVFIMGSQAGFALPVLSSFILLTACVFLSFAVLACCLKSRLANVLIYGAVFFVAWLSVSTRVIENQGAGMAAWAGALDGRVEIIGVVAGDPDIGFSESNKPSTWRFPLRVTKIRSPDTTWRDITATVRVLWYGGKNIGAYRSSHGASAPFRKSRRAVRARAPAYGQEWSIAGRLREYRHRGAGGRRRYFLSAGPGNSRCLSWGHGRLFTGACYAARRQAASLLSLGIEGHRDAVGILHAMLLGYRTRMSSRAREVFAATGTMHIFAISGLHVGMVAFLIIFVLTTLRISHITWALFLAPFLVAYTLATGARASAVRACIMAVIFFSAPLLRRKADVFSSLAFAALLILAFSPEQLMDVGFIYSFVVVTGLIVLYPFFEKPLRILGQPRSPMILRVGLDVDPLRVRREGWWLRTARWIVRGFASLAAVSCSAWLVSAPLNVHYFGRFSPIALPSNIFVIPLAFLIILAGSLSLALGACLSFFANVFNYANLALVSVLLRAVEGMARLPFGSLDVPKLPLWIIMGWYGCLGAVIAALKGRQENNTRSASSPIVEGPTPFRP